MKILTLLLLASCFGCAQKKETRKVTSNDGDLQQVKANLLNESGETGIHCFLFYGNGDPVYGVDMVADKRSNHGEFIVRCRGWK